MNINSIRKLSVVYFLIMTYTVLGAGLAQAHTLDQKYLDNILNGKAWTALHDATTAGDFEDKKIIKNIILDILNFEDSGNVTEARLIPRPKNEGKPKNQHPVEMWSVTSEYKEQKFKIKVLKKRIIPPSYAPYEKGAEQSELMAWKFDDQLNLGIVPPVVINSTSEDGKGGADVYFLFVDDAISDNYRILAPNDIGIEHDATIIMDHIFGNPDRLYEYFSTRSREIHGIDYPIKGWRQTNYLIDEDGNPIAIDNEQLVSAYSITKKEYISEEAYYDFAYSKDVYDAFISHSDLSPDGYETIFLEAYLAELSKEEQHILQQDKTLEKITERWNDIAKELHDRFGAPDYDWSNHGRLHKQYANNRKSAIDQFREDIDVPTNEYVLGTDISQSKNKTISELLLSKSRGDSKTLKKKTLCK